MDQLTKEQAIAMAENELYKTMDFREIAEFQIQQKFLCMPFSVFHEAVEKTVKRPVFTHEFGSIGCEGLKKEIFEGKEPPSFKEILDIIVRTKANNG